jgi:hypothetical protein
MPVDEIEYIVTVKPQLNEVKIGVPGPAGVAGPPGSGTGNSEIEIVGNSWVPDGGTSYAAGNQKFSTSGILWICSASGTPGTWFKISGFMLYVETQYLYPSSQTYPSGQTFPFALYQYSPYPSIDVYPSINMYPGS